MPRVGSCFHSLTISMRQRSFGLSWMSGPCFWCLMSSENLFADFPSGPSKPVINRLMRLFKILTQHSGEDKRLSNQTESMMTARTWKSSRKGEDLSKTLCVIIQQERAEQSHLKFKWSITPLTPTKVFFLKNWRINKYVVCIWLFQCSVANLLYYETDGQY